MLDLKKLVVIVSGALILTACGSSVKLDENAPVEDKSASGSSSSMDSRQVGTVTAGSLDPLSDPKGELAQRSVYFDFDSFVVSSQYEPVVQAHAKYLNSHKDKKVVIQGNTDDRGGREYNLALGQKRAEAVRKSMNVMGVSDSQIEAVSFGKEKPKATGNNDAAWAENRRADIVYQ